MQPQPGTDVLPLGCLRVNKGSLALKGPSPKPVCASLFPGSNWRCLGTAGDMPAVHLLHLKELAAEKHVFCPKRAAPFFLLRTEIAVITVTGTSPVFRLHAVNTHRTGRGVRAYEKRLPARTRHAPPALPAAAPRRTRVWQRPPLPPTGPGTDVTAARRWRPHPLVALPRPTRRAWG